MTKRLHRLRRIHSVTHGIYHHHKQLIAIIDQKLTRISRIESEIILYMYHNVPFQFTASRLDFIRQERLKLTRERQIELEKAMSAGLKLKRINRLLDKVVNSTPSSVSAIPQGLHKTDGLLE